MQAFRSRMGTMGFRKKSHMNVTIEKALYYWQKNCKQIQMNADS